MHPVYSGGFTVLMASLVAGAVLVLTVGILSFSTRGFQISGIMKRSTVALYNADAGVECALYHDIALAAFPEPTDSGTAEPASTPASAVVCLDASRAVSLEGGACTAPSGVRICTYSFTISDPLIEVTISKKIVGENHWTEIESRGKSGPAIGSQRTERISEYTYGNLP